MYLCTRCELDKLEDAGFDTRAQAQNSEWATVLYCKACCSNTDHTPVPS